ncbi:hypothetical protein F5888DRAFT_1728674 [Russula emetica]|nr:hypothetical protein F5888DRAFT_1728674 [Russula emetica]
MNRPRESLLTLFDPLFSGGRATPPPLPCRDVPSPDLGSDKENAVPSHGASSTVDNSITLTKFFNRVYTLPKAQLPRSLPKGRLIDVGDASASDDSDSDSDSDDWRREQHGFVANHETTLPTTGREEVARDSPPTTPLAMRKKSPSPSPLTRKGTPSSSLFGSPSPFKLARPTPAPSSSPLASVINAINGTTSRLRSPSLSPPSTPSAPRIAVTPAEPSSPSPKGRQLRPDTMLYASPDVDLQQRRTSVDLQEAMSVHFDESASFDLLKDKIMFPENDSLDADLDMEMASPPAMKVLEDRDQGDNIVTPIPEADAESENELNCLGMLGERLRDMNIVEEGDDFLQNKDEDRDSIISTPPVQFSNFNVASQYFILPCSIFTSQTKSTIAVPQAPVRQFIRPKNNKAQVPAASTARYSNAPPAPLLPRRNSIRPSISSALPMPASVSTAPQVTKKEKTKPGMTKMAHVIPASKPMRSTDVHSVQQPPRPRGSVSTMTLSGVQRPPAPALANVAHSRAMSVPSSAASSQRNKQMVTQAVPSSSKVTAVGASGLRRPSSLRAPTSRVGASGIAVLRASSAGVGASGARRVSMSTSMAVDGGGSGGGTLGLTGANKMRPVKASARMMRRV